MDRPVTKQHQFESDKADTAGSSLNRLDVESSPSKSSDSLDSILSSGNEGDSTINLVTLTKDAAIAEVAPTPAVMETAISEAAVVIVTGNTYVPAEPLPSESESKESKPILPVVRDQAAVVVVGGGAFVPAEPISEVVATAGTEKSEVIVSKTPESKVELPLALSSLIEGKPNVVVDGVILTASDKALEPYQLAMISERMARDVNFDPMKIDSTIHFVENIRELNKYVISAPVIVNSPGLVPANEISVSGDAPAGVLDRALQNVSREKPDIVIGGMKTEIVNKSLTEAQLALIGERVSRDAQFDSNSVTTTVNLAALVNSDLLSVTVEAPRAIVVAGSVNELPEARIATDSKGAEPVLPVLPVLPEAHKTAVRDDSDVRPEKPLASVLANLGQVVEARREEKSVLVSRYEGEDAKQFASPGIDRARPVLPVVSEGIVLTGSDRVETIGTANDSMAPAAAGGNLVDFFTRLRAQEHPENLAHIKEADRIPSRVEVNYNQSLPFLTQAEKVLTNQDFVALEAAGKQSVLVDTTHVKVRADLAELVSREPVLAREMAIAYSITPAETLSIAPREKVVVAGDLVAVPVKDSSAIESGSSFIAQIQAGVSEDNRSRLPAPDAAGRIPPVMHNGDRMIVSDKLVTDQDANALKYIAERTGGVSTTNVTDRSQLVSILDSDPVLARTVAESYVSSVSSALVDSLPPVTKVVVKDQHLNQSLPRVAETLPVAEVAPAGVEVAPSRSSVGAETFLTRIHEERNLGADVKPIIPSREELNRVDVVNERAFLTVQEANVFASSAGRQIDTHKFQNRSDMQAEVDRNSTLGSILANAYKQEPFVAALPVRTRTAETVSIDSGVVCDPTPLPSSVVRNDSSAVDFLARVRAQGGKVDVASERPGNGSVDTLPVVINHDAPQVVRADRLLTAQEFSALARTAREAGLVDTTNFSSRADLQNVVANNPILAKNIVQAYNGETDANTNTGGSVLARAINQVVKPEVDLVPSLPVIERRWADDGAASNWVKSGRDERSSVGVGIGSQVQPDVSVRSTTVSGANASAPDQEFFRGQATLARSSVNSNLGFDAGTISRASDILSSVNREAAPTMSLRGSSAASAFNAESISLAGGSFKSVVGKGVSHFDYASVKQVSEAYSAGSDLNLSGSISRIVQGGKSILTVGESKVNLSSIQQSALVNAEGLAGRAAASGSVWAGQVQNPNSIANQTRLEGVPFDGGSRASALTITTRSFSHSGSNNAVGASLIFTDSVKVPSEVKVSQFSGIAVVRLDGVKSVAAGISAGSGNEGGVTFGSIVKGEYNPLPSATRGEVKVVNITQAAAVAHGTAHGVKCDSLVSVVKVEGNGLPVKADGAAKSDATTVRAVEHVIQTARTFVNHNTAPTLVAAIKNGEPLPEGMSYENGFIKLTHNGQVLYFPGLRAALKFVEGLGIEVNLEEDEDDDQEWYVQTLDKKGKSSRVQYIVVPGDTIQSICQTRLGDARYGDLLITINRSEIVYRLQDGQKVPFVYPSQVIWLPNRYEMKVFRKNFFKEELEQGNAGCKAVALEISPSGNLVVHQNSAEGSASVRDGARTPGQVLERLHQEVIEHYAPPSQNRNPCGSVSRGSESGPLAIVIDRVRFAGGRDSVGLNEYPQAVGSLSQRTFHAVVAGDTIMSIARRHTLMGDTRFWKLIARVNGLTTRLDVFGNPCETLVPGQFLLMPDQKEIDEFARQEGIVLAPDRKLDAKTVLTSELHVVSYSDCCRVTEVDFNGVGGAFSVNLQARIDGQWKTIASYQFRNGQSVRTTYARTGVSSSMVINLPATVVREMAYEDFSRNWRNRIRLYETGERKGSGLPKPINAGFPVVS
ncbi:hypothetical protein GC174_17590 [bacterium]|nr:hypothetical protein [bacterium]